ncbi:hypothetical protein F5Y11DRAFT_70662 [Daldinia sp. FL1419]|nr:hypothetical protein F5Y11DRAFT_70662 [Daldinia sp. FL1419]
MVGSSLPAPTTAPTQAGSEQQQPDFLGPAYLLEWMETQHSCSRRRFASVQELRDDIQRHDKESGLTPRRRLLVVRGLPAEYLETLSELLDVDAGFVEAHAGRRSYRPLGRRRRDGAAGHARSACFEYPELSTASKGLGADMKSDVAGEHLHAISDDDVAVFCRASLWQCVKADILLLDCPEWVGKHRPSDLNQVLAAATSTEGDMSDFESLLYHNLVEEWRSNPQGDADICALIQDVAVHQWTEFFDIISPHISPSTNQMTALFWKAQESLERNLSSAELYERSLRTSSAYSPPPYSPASDWASLLSRLSRRVSLLSHLAPISNPNLDSIITSILPPPLSNPLTKTKSIPPTELIPRRRRRHRPTNTPSSSADDENKHALDRVSYMGGILLPLSIVSSILSMSDPFGPTGPLFYVFWAAGVPLVLVAILIIYADSIRKAEVWIEVASTGSPATDTNNEKQGRAEMPDLEGQGFRIAALGKGEDEDADGVEEMGEDSFDEPAMMVEKLFKDAGSRKWQREQLGWGGACKTALRIYKLKKGKPPNWVRHGRTA